MHLYANCDYYIPRVSRVISISLTASGRTDSHSDYSGQTDYIGLDNMKMYVNLDQNTPCDSKVMSNC